MRISETEAYIGTDDPACQAHASTRTARTEIMYEQGGVFYVLPDEAPIAETFPEFAQSRATAQTDD